MILSFLARVTDGIVKPLIEMRRNRFLSGQKIKINQFTFAYLFQVPVGYSGKEAFVSGVQDRAQR